MRSFLFLFVLGCLLYACAGKSHIPKDVIQPKAMEDLMWDLSRTDQWLTGFVFGHDSTLDPKSESIKLYEQIFSLHHTNKEKFQKSYNYYIAHPKIFKGIVDSIAARSGRIQADLPSSDTTRRRNLPQRRLIDTSLRRRPQ